jgi:hypothetical protein
VGWTLDPIASSRVFLDPRPPRHLKGRYLGRREALGSMGFYLMAFCLMAFYLMAFYLMVFSWGLDVRLNCWEYLLRVKRTRKNFSKS